jgi:hypothetical protein
MEALLMMKLFKVNKRLSYSQLYKSSNRNSQAQQAKYLLISRSNKEEKETREDRLKKVIMEE